jgi:hypothetical protein
LVAGWALQIKRSRPAAVLVWDSATHSLNFDHHNHLDGRIWYIKEPQKMNFPAASHGVSISDKIYPNAAICGELNPADFAISTAHLL